MARQSSRPTHPALAALVETIEQRFGDALEAVLHYGSCLHNDDPGEGVVDMFALVRDYRSVYRNPFFRLFNAVLPPNVFYFEVGEGERRIRAKYSVFSRAHFEAGTRRWFEPYIWVRLAQPSRVLWAKDQETLEWVRDGMARSVLTFHQRVLPSLAGEEVDATGIWRRGLTLTYRTELRTEGVGRANWLVERNGADYVRLTEAAETALAPLSRTVSGERYRVELPARERRRAARMWWLRRLQGKVLSTWRLGKSAFTFSGAADYVAMKIERHTGVPIRVTPFMRRHPFICSPFALVAFLKRGVIR